jgi:chitinase
VDIDWEYPSADDRGGETADTQNFVTLLKEMRAYWGTTYGISATIPSSYWYMRWFNLQDMSAYLDWFNFMSYDIHGVWDSTNKFTGPYVRPQNSSQVTLGLGWYGRSFTLADPSCSSPGCTFSAGGTAGQCTNSPGTLSNAEITRIISANSLTPTLDKQAAVKWIHWANNQWVSYDDGQTMQLKMQRASDLCLGGIMIWSIDQDDANNTSTDNLLGIGTSNGVSQSLKTQIRSGLISADQASQIANSCYWSFCDGTCTGGYFETTQARGIVGGINLDYECVAPAAKKLCCASGTTTGQCAWNGWSRPVNSQPCHSTIG